MGVKFTFYQSDDDDIAFEDYLPECTLCNPDFHLHCCPESFLHRNLVVKSALSQVLLCDHWIPPPPPPQTPCVVPLLASHSTCEYN